jgi:SAM-dependent methyltransferase
VCDAHHLPFKDGIFGAAVSFSTLEHLWNPFIAVNEIYRVLARNAQFAGEAAFLEAFHDKSYFHLSPMGLETCLRTNGFLVKHIWPGWGIGESMGHYVSKQYRMQYLGRGIGRAFDGLHKITVIGSNVMRRIVGKTSRPATEMLLSFAGSINWVALKADGEEAR